MRFLIDGYNLMHRLGLAQPRGSGRLERCRANLLEWLERVHGRELDSVTVVFDGREGIRQAKSSSTRGGIRIQFSVGQIADDLIEELIEHERSPRTLTVVSSDRRIQESARRRGCAFWSCDRYLEWSTDRGHTPPKPPQLPDKPEMPSAEELNHWQNEFAELDQDPELREFNQPYKDFFEN